MSLIGDLLSRIGVQRTAARAAPLPGESLAGTSERGRRATPENAQKYLYRLMWTDAELRQRIVDIRDMDLNDGRVKKIHGRTARAAVKGGLRLQTPSANTRLIRAWEAFERRLRLDRQEKLESDMRGLMMEGNLPLQWVLSSDSPRVVQCVRMPTETILPQVSADGVFKDVREAYHQYDLTSGAVLARFPLWQLAMVRLTPDNYDDLGSLGRPYLDASRKVWKQLRMTDEDLVVRRRMRAPLRMAHVLEGASPEDLAEYRAKVEADQAQGAVTDYYLNRKGAVNALQGDENLDQIADVAYLVETFFAGSPAPKGLFGYASDLSRDVLEDLKRDFFDELDAMQDTASYVYRIGFELDLLLAGINPDAYTFDVQFAERRTDTANQRADLALKYQALGVGREIAWKAAGLDPSEVREQLEAESREDDPYPDPLNIGRPAGTPRVSVTPGNAPKGESATSITTRSGA